jgi:SAM-dependent methyltransferase
MKQGEIDYLRAIGPAGQQHAMNKPYSDNHCGSYLIAMGQIMGLLPPPPARILDLGCGTGWTSVMLAKRGYDVVGFDISPDMIAAATELQRLENVSNVRFHVGDYESVEAGESFDGVLFFDALHHAEDEKAALASVHRVLRKGGVCVASEPGRGHSSTPEAIRAIEQFGVNEKDMPPTHVATVTQGLSFKIEVYPHLSQIAQLLARAETGSQNVSRGRRLVRERLIRPILIFLLIIHLKQHNGIVVLTKG